MHVYIFLYSYIYIIADVLWGVVTEHSLHRILLQSTMQSQLEELHRKVASIQSQNMKLLQHLVRLRWFIYVTLRIYAYVLLVAKQKNFMHALWFI